MYILEEALKRTDEELKRDLQESLGEERTAVTKFLVTLSQIDERKIYAVEGYRSLFVYLKEKFNFSEAAALRRSQICRLIRNFPKILELIESGRLHLTGASLISPHLTCENEEALLEAVCGKGADEIKDILTAFGVKVEKPRKDSIRSYSVPVSTATVHLPAQGDAAPNAMPDAVPDAVADGVADGVPDALTDALPVTLPDAVRDAGISQTAERCLQPQDERNAVVPSGSPHRIPENSLPADAGRFENKNIAPPGHAHAPSSEGNNASTSQNATPLQAEDPKTSRQRRTNVVADASTLNRETRAVIRFTCSGKVVDKIKRGRQLIGEEKSLEELFDEALDLLLSKKDPLLREKRRKERSSRSRGIVHAKRQSGRKKPTSRRKPIPVAVKDSVFAHADFQCTYVSEEGHRCTARGKLEIDHRIPVALGGGNEPENLRCLCREHNRLEAERMLGRDVFTPFQPQSM